jgi:hypothetical protein
MPHIEHIDNVDAARSTDEQFLEWLCADEDLLRAEFDAIIGAEWPGPPPAGPRRDTDAGRPPGQRPCHDASVAGLPARPGHPGIGGWTRQRSPPAGSSDNRTQERQVIAPA